MSDLVLENSGDVADVPAVSAVIMAPKTPLREEPPRDVTPPRVVSPVIPEKIPNHNLLDPGFSGGNQKAIESAVVQAPMTDGTVLPPVQNNSEAHAQSTSGGEDSRQEELIILQKIRANYQKLLENARAQTGKNTLGSSDSPRNSKGSLHNNENLSKPQHRSSAAMEIPGLRSSQGISQASGLRPCQAIGSLLAVPNGGDATANGDTRGNADTSIGGAHLPRLLTVSSGAHMRASMRGNGGPPTRKSMGPRISQGRQAPGLEAFPTSPSRGVSSVGPIFASVEKNLATGDDLLDQLQMVEDRRASTDDRAPADSPQTAASRHSAAEELPDVASNPISVFDRPISVQLPRETVPETHQIINRSSNNRSVRFNSRSGRPVPSPHHRAILPTRKNHEQLTAENQKILTSKNCNPFMEKADKFDDGEKSADEWSSDDCDYKHDANGYYDKDGNYYAYADDQGYYQTRHKFFNEPENFDGGVPPELRMKFGIACHNLGLQSLHRIVMKHYWHHVKHKLFIAGSHVKKTDNPERAVRAGVAVLSRVISHKQHSHDAPCLRELAFDNLLTHEQRAELFVPALLSLAQWRKGWVRSHMANAFWKMKTYGALVATSKQLLPAGANPIPRENFKASVTNDGSEVVSTFAYYSL